MQENLTEEFRSVTDWPNYAVSDLGRIRSRGRWGTSMIMRPKRNGSGHCSVTLCKIVPGIGKVHKRMSVHVLVLEAFVGPRPPGMEACHDPDPNPTNNRLSNLRWDTKSANQRDSVRHGTHRCRNGRKIRPEDIPDIRRRIASGEFHRSIARDYGCNRSTISMIRGGRIWSHIA